MALIIGLDFGEKFGYAALKADGSFETCGVWALKRSSDLHFGIRLTRLDQNLLRLYESFTDPVVLAYESVAHHAGTRAAHVYGAYLGAVERFASEQSLAPLVPVAVSSVKKSATGSGKASKELMVRSAKERWSIQGTLDENAADALWVAETARLTKIR